MALYSQGKKVESTGLSIRYGIEARIEQVETAAGTLLVQLYIIKRFCRKEYAYIGLTLEGAKALMNQKIAQYTRHFHVGELDSAVYQCQASIAIDKHGAGYRVNISVNDEDVVIVRDEPPRDPASVFSYGGNYDEDIGSLFDITGISRVNNTVINVSYKANISGFRWEGISAEVSFDEGQTWTYPITTEGGGNQSVNVSVNRGQTYLIRLAYGNIRSNVMRGST